MLILDGVGLGESSVVTNGILVTAQERMGSGLKFCDPDE
jgi:hypothetical protein